MRPEDVDMIQRSRPEDYTGVTAFARMNALERLRWLDMAVDFVVRQKALRARAQ